MRVRTLLLGLAILLCLDSPVVVVAETGQADEIGIQKVEEFYLRLERGLPLSFSGRSRPAVELLSNGNIVLHEYGGTWFCFLDRRGRLIRISGGEGLVPGKFPKICRAVTISDKDEVVATDMTGRVNIFDSRGNLITSVIVPPAFDMAPDLAAKYGDLLVVGAKYPDGRLSIVVYDIKTASRVSEFFNLSQEEVELLKSKAGLRYWHTQFCISQKGHVLCNRTTDHRIFEYTISGELCHVYDEYPPGYVSVLDVEPGPSAEELATSSDALAAAEKWDSTWTYSSRPSLYGEDMFVVVRSRAGRSRLDFYSISEKRYIGYCELGGKSFLCSDSDWLYLCESYSDSLIVVGKYVALIGEEAAGQVELEVSPESLVGSDIRVIVTPEDSAWTFVPRSDFNVVDLSGRLRPFRKFLTSRKRHFVIFVRPFYNCPFLLMYEPVKEFCSENSGYDIYVVVSHPYKEELEFLVKGLKLEAKIIPNLDPNLVKDLIPSYPTGLMVLEKDGSKVLGVYSAYDLYANLQSRGGKCIDAFLEEIRNMDTRD